MSNCAGPGCTHPSHENDKLSQAEDQGEQVANALVATAEASIQDAVAEADGTGKKRLTQAEWKKLMRVYFTVRHPRVTQCGHTLDANREPRRTNCEHCWFAFFNQHGELVQTADSVFQEHGAKALASLRGDKFVRNFTRFMATLAQWKAAQEAAKQENDEQGSGSPDRSGRESSSTDRGSSGDTGSGLEDSQAADDGREVEGAEGSRSGAQQAV